MAAVVWSKYDEKKLFKPGTPELTTVNCSASAKKPHGHAKILIRSSGHGPADDIPSHAQDQTWHLQVTNRAALFVAIYSTMQSCNRSVYNFQC